MRTSVAAAMCLCSGMIGVGLTAIIGLAQPEPPTDTKLDALIKARLDAAEKAKPAPQPTITDPDVAGAFKILSQKKPEPVVITASEFRLVDASGKTLGSWMPDEGGVPHLEMGAGMHTAHLDPDGLTVGSRQFAVANLSMFGLRVDGDGDTLTIGSSQLDMNTGGSPISAVRLVSRGGLGLPFLAMYDTKDIDTSPFDKIRDEAPSPQSKDIAAWIKRRDDLYDSVSKERRRIVISDEDNGGSLKMYNKTSELVSECSVDPYGNGDVAAYDRQGKGSKLRVAR